MLSCVHSVIQQVCCVLDCVLTGGLTAANMRDLGSNLHGAYTLTGQTGITCTHFQMKHVLKEKNCAWGPGSILQEGLSWRMREACQGSNV